MFDKLRLKMTLINVGVTAVLFAILIAGVYILLVYNSQRSTDYFLERLTQKIIANQITDFTPRVNRDDNDKFPGFIPPPPRPNFFFIKTSFAGDPFMFSNNMTINQNESQNLIYAVLTEASDTGTLILQQKSFAYQRTALPDNAGVLIVINDLSDELEARHVLLMNLLYVGLFCMLLSFIASFYMAKQAIKPIQYALNQQKNFVSDASHELRTPITIMQTNLDILNSAPSGDTIENNKKWLTNLQNETSRMTELINSLLFLARADANRQMLEREYVCLNQVVLDTVTPLQILAKAKELKITTSIPNNLIILGDAARLKQLLTILIDNALKHTPPHGTISITGILQAGRIMLIVKDTGIGIAAEHLSKIFDRFYQVDDSRHKGGAGLGLSMAKWIIEQHQGTIKVTSTVGQGTTFTINFPIGKIQ